MVYNMYNNRVHVRQRLLLLLLLLLCALYYYMLTCVVVIVHGITASCVVVYCTAA